MPLTPEQHPQWFKLPPPGPAKRIERGEFPQSIAELLAHLRQLVLNLIVDNFKKTHGELPADSVLFAQFVQAADEAGYGFSGEGSMAFPSFDQMMAVQLETMSGFSLHYTLSRVFAAIKYELEQALSAAKKQKNPQESLRSLNDSINQLCGPPATHYWLGTDSDLHLDWPKFRQRLWQRMQIEGYSKSWEPTKPETKTPSIDKSQSLFLPVTESTVNFAHALFTDPRDIFLYIELFDIDQQQQQQLFTDIIKQWLYTYTDIEFLQKSHEIISLCIAKKMLHILPFLAYLSEQAFCEALCNSELIKTLEQNPELTQKLRQIRGTTQLQKDLFNITEHASATTLTMLVKSKFFTKELICLPNSEGDTALHKAVFCGKEDTIRFLLSLGANPFHANNMAITPAEMAKDFNIQLLLTTEISRGEIDHEISFDHPHSKDSKDQTSMFALIPPQNNKASLLIAIEADDEPSVAQLFSKITITKELMAELLKHATDHDAEASLTMLWNYCEENPGVSPISFAAQSTEPSVSSSSSSAPVVSLTLNTEGDGNCACHAVFGKPMSITDPFSGVSQIKLYDTECKEHRNKLAADVLAAGVPDQFSLATKSVLNFIAHELATVRQGNLPLLSTKSPLLLALYTKRNLTAEDILPAHVWEYAALMREHNINDPNKKLITQYGLILTGIMAVIYDQPSIAGKLNLLKLKAEYQLAFPRKKEAWELLSRGIKAHPELMNLIADMCHLHRIEYGTVYSTLEEQYIHMRNRCKEAFEKALKQANLFTLYEHYEHVSSEGLLTAIKPEHIENLFKEYSEFLAEDRRYLTTDELELIAIRFQISINYHVKDASSGTIALVKILNPGCPASRTYDILHNGINHFERMTTSPQPASEIIGTPTDSKSTAPSLTDSLSMTLHGEIRNGSRRKRPATSIEAGKLDASSSSSQTLPPP